MDRQKEILMKPRTFVEPRWVAAIFGGLVFFLGCGAAAVSFLMLAIKEQFAEFDLMYMALFIFCEVIFAFGILYYVLFWLPKTFSLLTVSSEKIVWRCPFYKTIKLNIEDCKYVSVEDMADHNRAMPVIRGDEIAYIYLSDKPFPNKYKHKADVVRRKKGTITFAYSDKLCQALIEALPEDKTKYLVSFYGRMQVSDTVNRLKQQKKKKRK